MKWLILADVCREARTHIAYETKDYKTVLLNASLRPVGSHHPGAYCQLTFAPSASVLSVMMLMHHHILSQQLTCLPLWHRAISGMTDEKAPNLQDTPKARFPPDLFGFIRDCSNPSSRGLPFPSAVWKNTDSPYDIYTLERTHRWFSPAPADLLSNI